jgi:hypothetical protein
MVVDRLDISNVFLFCECQLDAYCCRLCHIRVGICCPFLYYIIVDTYHFPVLSALGRSLLSSMWCGPANTSQYPRCVHGTVSSARGFYQSRLREWYWGAMGSKQATICHLFQN